MSALKLADYNRRFRVLDQMLTGHSIERDRFVRRSTALTLTIIALSIVATMVAFISGERDVDFGVVTMTVQTSVGLLSAFIFFLGLLDLKVDWRQRAWSHEQAVDRLAELKAKYRAAKTVGDEVSLDGVDLLHEYDMTMEAIVAVPEGRFLALKARHKRKVAISRLLDTRPGTPVPWLRLTLLVDGLRNRSPGKAGRAGATDADDDRPAGGT
jgi:hypothetical protein